VHVIRRTRQTVPSSLDHKAAWLLFISGLALLGVTLLTPAWHAGHLLAAQEHILRAQSDQLSRQERAYRSFLAAVDRRHPVLMRRLAFDQLRLKPVGTTVLPTQMKDEAGRGPAGTTLQSHEAASTAWGLGAWLKPPALTDVGAATESLAAASQSPLAEDRPLLAMLIGPSRLVLFACAAVLMALGLLLPIERAAEEAADGGR
jgi:hypothetical protein